jgi:dipeptidyl aminopeptidase/acylaminoacyl peptidase
MSASPARRLSPADSFAFRGASEVQIAPDGGRIAYLLTDRDIATDQKRSNVMLTSDRAFWTALPESEGTSVLRWAPDGRRLALLRRVAGSLTLSVRDVESGRSKALIDSKAPLRELAWSPDGTQIAFQQWVEAPPPAWLRLPQAPQGASWAPPAKVTERFAYRHDVTGEMPEGSFQTFVVPADSSAAPRQVTSGPWSNGLSHRTSPGLTWSADGTELLFGGTQRPDWDAAPLETDIFAVRVADGAVRQVTRHPGMAKRPAPSPDGRWLAYLVNDIRTISHQHHHLFVMPAAGGPARELMAEADRSIDEIAWSADSSALFVAYDAEGRREVALLPLAGGAPKVVVDDLGSGQIEMPYAGGGFSVSGDGTIAYVQSRTAVPADVAVVSPTGESRSLTALNAELAREIGGFHEAEELWIAGGEGRRVQAWLMLPRGPGPHPMILEIHGGPYAQYGDRFAMKYQMLAAGGYAVLAVNPCGSTGYGEAFGAALHDRFPGPDYDDLMAAVDHVVKRPEIDAGNLFVSGVSGGGILSLWIVTHTHRFRAAVSIKPVVSWESWLLTADMGPTDGVVWMGGDLPWNKPEKYRSRSPLSFAGEATTPTLVIVGESDARTPPTEGMQMYAALKLAGVEAGLVRLPGTSHASSAMRPSLFAAEVACILGWCDRYRGRAAE